MWCATSHVPCSVLTPQPLNSCSYLLRASAGPCSATDRPPPELEEFGAIHTNNVFVPHFLVAYLLLTHSHVRRALVWQQPSLFHPLGRSILVRADRYVPPRAQSPGTQQLAAAAALAAEAAAGDASADARVEVRVSYGGKNHVCWSARLRLATHETIMSDVGVYVPV